MRNAKINQGTGTWIICLLLMNREALEHQYLRPLFVNNASVIIH